MFFEVLILTTILAPKNANVSRFLMSWHEKHLGGKSHVEKLMSTSANETIII